MSKNVLKFVCSLVLLNYSTPSSHASLWLEPYLGMSFSGQYKLSASGTTRDYDNYPWFLGARVGAAYKVFQFGIDYTKSGDVELEGDSKKYQITQWGLFAGMKFPILVRGYLEYIVSSEFSDTGATYDEGSGFKAGIGYTGLPMVIINLEVQQVTYDKYNGGGTDMQNKSTSLSVSLPLEL